MKSNKTCCLKAAQRMIYPQKEALEKLYSTSKSIPLKLEEHVFEYIFLNSDNGNGEDGSNLLFITELSHH